MIQRPVSISFKSSQTKRPGHYQFRHSTGWPRQAGRVIGRIGLERVANGESVAWGRSRGQGATAGASAVIPNRIRGTGGGWGQLRQPVARDLQAARAMSSTPSDKIKTSQTIFGLFIIRRKM